MPRFCQVTPVSLSTTPEPNSQYTLWMKLTERPSLSMQPIQMVSPGAAGSGQGRATCMSMVAARSLSADSDRKPIGSAGSRPGSVTTRSRTRKARLVDSTSP